MSEDSSTSASTSSITTTSSTIVQIIQEIDIIVIVHQGQNLVCKDRNIIGHRTSSDPFVRVSILGQLYGTTSIQYKTINPIWNGPHDGEQFHIRITNIKLIPQILRTSLLFTIWDYDKITKHDCMGIVSIPISDILLNYSSTIQQQQQQQQSSTSSLNEQSSSSSTSTTNLLNFHRQFYPVQKGKGTKYYCYNATGQLEISIAATVKTQQQQQQQHQHNLPSPSLMNNTTSSSSIDTTNNNNSTGTVVVVGTDKASTNHTNNPNNTATTIQPVFIPIGSTNNNNHHHDDISYGGTKGCFSLSNLIRFVITIDFNNTTNTTNQHQQQLQHRQVVFDNINLCCIALSRSSGDIIINDTVSTTDNTSNTNQSITIQAEDDTDDNDEPVLNANLILSCYLQNIPDDDYVLYILLFLRNTTNTNTNNNTAFQSFQDLFDSCNVARITIRAEQQQQQDGSTTADSFYNSSTSTPATGSTASSTSNSQYYTDVSESATSCIYNELFVQHIQKKETIVSSPSSLATNASTAFHQHHHHHKHMNHLHHLFPSLLKTSSSQQQQQQQQSVTDCTAFYIARLYRIDDGLYATIATTTSTTSTVSSGDGDDDDNHHNNNNDDEDKITTKKGHIAGMANIITSKIAAIHNPLNSRHGTKYIDYTNNDTNNNKTTTTTKKNKKGNIKSTKKKERHDNNNIINTFTNNNNNNTQHHWALEQIECIHPTSRNYGDLLFDLKCCTKDLIPHTHLDPLERLFVLRNNDCIRLRDYNNNNNNNNNNKNRIPKSIVQRTRTAMNRYDDSIIATTKNKNDTTVSGTLAFAFQWKSIPNNNLTSTSSSSSVGTNYNVNYSNLFRTTCVLFDSSFQVVDTVHYKCHYSMDRSIKYTVEEQQKKKTYYDESEFVNNNNNNTIYSDTEIFEINIFNDTVGTASNNKNNHTHSSTAAPTAASATTTAGQASIRTMVSTNVQYICFILINNTKSKDTFHDTISNISCTIYDDKTLKTIATYTYNYQQLPFGFRTSDNTSVSTNVTNQSTVSNTIVEEGNEGSNESALVMGCLFFRGTRTKEHHERVVDIDNDNCVDGRNNRVNNLIFNTNESSSNNFNVEVASEYTTTSSSSTTKEGSTNNDTDNDDNNDWYFVALADKCYEEFDQDTSTNFNEIRDIVTKRLAL